MKLIEELQSRDLSPDRAAVSHYFLQRRSKQLSDQRTGSVGWKLCGHRLAPCREIRSTLERQLN
ncbi:MAG: hypothetical protein M3P49_17070 [Actinomycetota bacterium]|nr:hypothetical protein [Actinomycetota bacterium]